MERNKVSTKGQSRQTADNFLERQIHKAEKSTNKTRPTAKHRFLIETNSKAKLMINKETKKNVSKGNSRDQKCRKGKKV